MGVKKPRYKWTPAALDIVIEKYSTTTAPKIGRMIGASKYIVIRKARDLGIKKTHEFNVRHRLYNLNKSRFVPPPPPPPPPAPPVPIRTYERYSRKEAAELGVAHVTSTNLGLRTLPPCPSQIELLDLLQGSIKYNTHVPVHRASKIF